MKHIKSEIEALFTEVAYKAEGFVDKDDPRGLVAKSRTSKEVLDEATAKAIALFERLGNELLPKKKPRTTFVEASKDIKLWELAQMNAGYNQAIDDARQLLKQMLKGDL